jgi:hypothetical protein
MQSLKKNWIYVLILVIGIGGIAFGAYEIHKLSSNKTATATNDQNPSQGGNNPGGGGGRQWGQGGGRGNFTPPVHGTIASISGSTIVMTADDGSTKNVAVSGTTRITETQNGSRTTLQLSDLKQGEEISVMNSGTDTTNLTARMIIIGTFTPPQRGQYPSQNGGSDSTGNNSVSGSGQI